MKKLKIYLLMLLVFSIFIPKTHAFEINGATFTQPTGYINADTNKRLLYDVVNGLNRFSYFLPNEDLNYYIRLEGVDNVNVSSGQLLLYVNVCLTPHPDQRLQVLDHIENTIGRVNDLEQIANNMSNVKGSCDTGDGIGYLHQGVWAMSYVMERNQDNGYSFLDSKIHFTGNGTIPYSQVFSFNNIYVAEYDESVVQTMKQQQISEQTNLYLQQQINQQQQTNEKLDNLNDSIQDTQDYLKDDTAPSADINVLGNVQGILPEGPIDSLLNIPFKVLSILNSSFGGVCVPISGKFVFDSTLTIPCFSELFYNNVPDGIMIFINVVPTAFILIAYLKNLYKRVDRALSLETSADDEWGGI